MAAETLIAVENENDLAALLDDLSAFIPRYVVLTQAQADAAALRIVHTHALDAAEFTPYLHIHSPMLRSGKTLLLNVLNLLVSKPWMTGRVSGAVLVRKTDKEQPTLLLDESDTAFQAEPEYAEALRGILNTGFQRTGCVSICVKDAGDWGYRNFKTFSPKAIAGIGRLPQTIEDRSIPIELKRKRGDDHCERLRTRRVGPQAKALQERAARWAAQNAAGLREAEPLLPEELNDRQQDVCEPLLAIADRAGGDWPTRARSALVELFSNRRVQDTSPSLRLLLDIRSVFQRRATDRLPSRDLLKELVSDETAPWGEWRGKSLSPTQLAAMVRPFGISPRDLRVGSQTLKGYFRSDFEDSWERYLPDLTNPRHEGQQGRQASVYAVPEHLSIARQQAPVASNNDENQPVFMHAVADVAPHGQPNGKMRLRFCWQHPFDETWRQQSDGTWVCGYC